MDQDLPAILVAGGIAVQGGRADDREVVVDHIGENEHTAAGPEALRQPPPLDAAQMLANGIDLLDRKIAAQHEIRHLLQIRQRQGSHRPFQKRRRST